MREVICTWTIGYLSADMVGELLQQKGEDMGTAREIWWETPVVETAGSKSMEEQVC